MPYSRRTGKRYAAGSHATWSEGDSRVCAICGGTLRIKKDALTIHYDAVTKTHSSWHSECGRRVRDGD